MICKINQEALVLLGGGRAILLQLAHPLIMSGVAEHSYFQNDILRRLHRTMYFMHTIVLESPEKIRLALDQFNKVHHRVKGSLKYDAGAYSTGTNYSGQDPDLKLWVFATFLDSALKTYETFVKPLNKEELKSFYKDALKLAKLMEIPQQYLPETFEELQNYMDEMMASGFINVTGKAKELARDVLYPKVGLVPYLSAVLLRFVTSGLMPESLRNAYGMKWNGRRAFLLNVFSRITRTLRPFVPHWIWQSPLLGGQLSRLILWGSLPEFRQQNP